MSCRIVNGWTRNQRSGHRKFVLARRQKSEPDWHCTRDARATQSQCKSRRGSEFDRLIWPAVLFYWRSRRACEPQISFGGRQRARRADEIARRRMRQPASPRALLPAQLPDLAGQGGVLLLLVGVGNVRLESPEQDASCRRDATVTTLSLVWTLRPRAYLRQ